MSLLHAEYLKISRRKLFPVMALILLFLVVISAFVLIAFGQIAPELAEDVPVLEKPDAYVIGAQQVASQTWFPIILAVVMLGGELASTVWATSLTRDSRRLAHILSRLTTFTIASWLAFVLGTGLWAAIAFVAAPGSGAPELIEWLGLLWRLAAVVVAWTSLGLGAVAMLRSVGPAIGAALALAFGEGILGFWGPYENVSLTAATNGLFGDVLPGGMGAFIQGADLSTAHALAIIVGWSLLGLGLTYWGLQRRDA